MAFYLTIEKETFKIATNIIIGRGAPFTHLNEYKDIEREHARIFKTKKGYFIRDLGSKSGTFVNGERLQKNKSKAIELTDEIKIADHIISLSVEKQAEGSIIKRSIGSVKIYPAWKIFLALEGLGAFIIFLETDTLRFGDFFTLTIPVFFISAYIHYLMKATTRNTVKELYWGKDGFTIHYNDKTNMSVLYDDIETIKKAANKGLLIEAYDTDIPIDKHSKNDEFKEILEQKCDPEVFSNKSNLSLISGLLAISCVIIMQVYSEYMYLFYLTFGALFIIAYNNDRLANVFFGKFSDAKMKKTRKKFMIAGFVLIFLSWGEYKDEVKAKKHMKLATNCLEKQDSVCQSFPFKVKHNITKYRLDEKKYKKLVNLGCFHNNEDACKIQEKLLNIGKGRVPAKKKDIPIDDEFL